MPIPQQPPPYYTHFFNPQGDIAEPWKRFLLATSTNVQFLLNTQQRVGSLQGVPPLEDFEDDRFALTIPGAAGTPGVGGSVLGGGVANQVAFWTAPNTIGGDPGFLYTAATGATLTAPAGATALTLTGGTQTTSFPVLSATQTWNAAGVTFMGMKLNVTDTASAVGSLLQDWQVGATSQAALRKDGMLFANRLAVTSGRASPSALSGTILAAYASLAGSTFDIVAIDFEPGFDGSYAIAAGKSAYGLYNLPVFTEAASGVHPLILGARFEAPAITNGVATTTEASTVYIGAAPTLGVSNYSLHVIGASLFAGTVTIGTSLLTLAGAFTTSGANAITLTTTGATTVTLPTSGTLLASGGALGTPSSGTATNLTGLPLTTGVSGVLPVANGGTASSTALSGTSIMISNGSAVVQGALGTTTTLLHGNAAGAPTYSAVSLTADVTGTLPVANGGTGAATFTANGVLYGNTTGAILVTAQGATNSVLTASAGAPSFSATPTVTSLTTTGAVTVGGLADLSGAGAGRIQFPATQNPSSNVNTLDDYAEGTFTPTDQSGASLTFTSASGTYTKVGKVVWINILVQYPVTASGAAAKIGNLPFSASSAFSALSAGFTNTSLNITYYVRESSTNVEMFLNTGVAVTNAQLSTFIIEGAGTYQAVN